MDPAGLALAAFSTLKEVYLLSKFVLRVISSAMKHQVERARLHLQFRHEFIFLRSFGILLTKKDNTVLNDDELDSDWLKHIVSILEQLRIAYGDYAKIAAAKDDEYRRFSPYSPSSATAVSKTIEFSLDVEENPVDVSSAGQHLERFSWLSEYTKTLRNGDWRWALFQKRKLEEILGEFKMWNGMLKELVPITLAAGRSSNGCSGSRFSDRASEEDINRLGVSVHTQLRKLNIDEHTNDTDVRLRDVSLVSPEVTQFSPLSYGVLSRDKNDCENVLIEYKPTIHPSTFIDGAGPKQSLGPSHTETEAVRLASLLRLAGKSGLRTLPFLGYIEKPSMEPPQHAFLFRYPERALEQSPVSLHEMISSEYHNILLENRFGIAKRVATSLWTLHTDNWVHKSFRSQSIVFFLEQGGVITCQDPYLVNFEYSRPANQNTTWTWDQDEDKNLYRHPERQGFPTRSFDKTHDAYALGVVLLEIGLWQTAFDIREQAKQARRPAVRFDRYDLKESYIAFAKQRLARTMGLSYQDAVLTCLVGDFTCKVHDDGFGMEFYERVVQRLDLRRLLLSAETTVDKS
ncbi:hypothetical protein IMSHALPRED_000728 [Imshaugia aleurites]|uniref:Protein kinase domain-containing protein n=1 Tax=Imshaugia aleurites TaxID=172621 RepID=A0A8H3G8T3_9LECA|nr:hypothetical protein IMSHALPRED_000728 [Imshaugia aleurites]